MSTAILQVELPDPLREVSRSANWLLAALSVVGLGLRLWAAWEFHALRMRVI